MRVVISASVISLALAYATYFVTPADQRSIALGILSPHMVLIVLTALFALIGLWYRSWICLAVLVAVIPLVYLQFHSASF